MSNDKNLRKAEKEITSVLFKPNTPTERFEIIGIDGQSSGIVNGLLLDDATMNIFVKLPDIDAIANYYEMYSADISDQIKCNIISDDPQTVVASVGVLFIDYFDPSYSNIEKRFVPILSVADKVKEIINYLWSIDDYAGFTLNCFIDNRIAHEPSYVTNQLMDAFAHGVQMSNYVERENRLVTIYLLNEMPMADTPPSCYDPGNSGWMDFLSNTISLKKSKKDKKKKKKGRN